MIELESVASRRPPLSRASVSLTWGAGAHSLLGTAADGVPLLLALAAGWERARAGTIRVLGASPLDPAIRPQVAFVPRVPPLPAALRVDETLDLAASIRGEPRVSAADRLASLGVEALAPRKVRSLAPDERRAVALAEAITSTRVQVLLVDEPLVGVDPRAAGRVAEKLRERARAGWAVIAGTASVRDACDLGDDHVVLRAGRVEGHVPWLYALTAPRREWARLRIVTDGPAALAQALVRDPAVYAVARTEGSLVARGPDLAALAEAAGRAVIEAGVDVREMRIESVPASAARPRPS